MGVLPCRTSNTVVTVAGVGVEVLRAMATTSKQPRVVGYNVQSAVDTETHIIVTHDVTSQGFDRAQLSPMATSSKEALVALEQYTGDDAAHPALKAFAEKKAPELREQAQAARALLSQVS